MPNTSKVFPMPDFVFLVCWEDKAGSYSGSSFVAAQSSYIARHYIESTGDKVTSYQFVGELSQVSPEVKKQTTRVFISKGGQNA